MRGFVRPGLRLQILLLLGGVLVLAFVPLFFAVATYTRFTLQEVRASAARSLGRAVAGQIAEARRDRAQGDLSSLLRAQLGEGGVEAIGVYDTNGIEVLRVAEYAAAALPAKVDAQKEAARKVTTDRGEALLVVLPDAQGAVATLLRTDEASAKVEPLIPLVGLYMGLIGLTVLLLAYFALTRFIVRPLDAMSRAAERVATGARRFDLRAKGARELVDLGQSLHTMTQKLLDEERALRNKIEEVEQATRRLKEAQERLIRSERLASVGRLSAGLAHEVGNPISALIGMQDLLIAGGLSEEEQRDFLNRMRNETERINRILRDLLQFARPAAVAEGDALLPGDVEAAIYDTVTLVTPQQSLKNVDIAVDVFPDLPRVQMTREQLVQVLLNLLLNSADACNGSGRITVSARPSRDGVELSVADSGPGVAPEVRDRLFEPFVTTKDVGKGTGLGLAVCRGLVEAAGGTISLDTAYAPGARFVVELRAAR